MSHYDYIYIFLIFLLIFALCIFVSLLLRCLMVYDVYLLCELCLLSLKIFLLVSFLKKEKKVHNKCKKKVIKEKKTSVSLGLPRWPCGERTCLQCKRHGFDTWVEKISWSRKWQPTPVFFLGNPRDRGAWWATVHRVSKRWTQFSDWTHTQACKSVRLYPV